jgi:DNA-binding CsgD family transcriptional regulator
MLPDRDQFGNLIANIYDAATEPQLWPTLLMRLSNILDDASLVFRKLRGRELHLIETARFEASLYRPEHLSPDANPGMRASIGAPPGTYIEMTDESEHRRCLVYNDVLRPQQLWHAGVLVLEKEPLLTILSVFRRAQAPFKRTEVDLLLALMPHLQRASQIARQLLCLDARCQAVEEIVAHLPYGVVFLDAEGEVLFLSPIAEAIVAAADGLSIRHGRIRAGTVSETTGLRRLISEAIEAGAGRGTGVGGALALSRPSMRKPLEMQVSPLRLSATGLGPRRPAAVVFISDPERAPETPVTPLSRLFGLTRREASLAARLAQGQDLKTAARGLAMAPSTARTHLKAVFEKTSTHRQSDLIQLLLRIPAGLWTGDALELRVRERDR